MKLFSALLLLSAASAQNNEDDRFEMEVAMDLKDGNLTECSDSVSESIRTLIHKSIETHARQFLNDLGLDGDSGFDLDNLYHDPTVGGGRRLELSGGVLKGSGRLEIFEFEDEDNQAERRRLEDWEEEDDEDDENEEIDDSEDDEDEYSDEYEEIEEDEDEEIDESDEDDEEEEDGPADFAELGDENEEIADDEPLFKREDMEKFISDKVTEDVNMFASTMAEKNHGEKSW